MHELLEKLGDLPAIPSVVQELIQSFNNPDLDSHHLAQKISQDPALTVKMLRVANSAFYGLSREVGSIHEAVVLLGFAAVRSLALSAAFINHFPPDSRSCLDRRSYWKRRVAVGCHAKSLASCMGVEPDMAFTAGLLNDIGVMVMDVCARERFGVVWRKAEESGVDLLQLERDEFGIDHAELGAEAAKQWKFPAAIVDVIRFHYQPEHKPCAILTCLVEVASLLVEAREKGPLEIEWLERIPSPLREVLEPKWDCVRDCLPGAAQLESANDLLLT
jgi:putative nucleotidyltransferase with HDIG domain